MKIQNRTAAVRIAVRGSRLSALKPLLSSNLYPQAAGNNFPAAASEPGSRSAENIIPESIMDGRKISWEIMVSFAWFLRESPRTQPTERDTVIKIASALKYKGKFDGTEASKITGAAR